MWSDEFWSYDPLIFYEAFSRKQSVFPNTTRAVLRVIETKTFEQIKLEQGK